MIQALVEHLIKSVGGMDRDWEVVEVNINELTDPSANKVYDAKHRAYMEKIREGATFPPIIVDENNRVLDGTHRLKAHIGAGRETINILRAVGRGTGKLIRDDVLEPLLNKLKGSGRENEFFRYSDKDPQCLVCKGNMQYVRDNYCLSYNPVFPDGFPQAPFYYCAGCGIIANSKQFVGWVI